MPFRIPSQIVNIGHLAIGAFFAYIGYYKKMNKQISTILIILGALAVAYHLHLLYLDQQEFFVVDHNSSRSNISNKVKSDVEDPVTALRKREGFSPGR